MVCHRHWPQRAPMSAFYYKPQNKATPSSLLSEDKVQKGYGFAWSKLSISTWHLIEWIILSQLLGEQMAQHVL